MPYLAKTSENNCHYTTANVIIEDKILPSFWPPGSLFPNK